MQFGANGYNDTSGKYWHNGVFGQVNGSNFTLYNWVINETLVATVNSVGFIGNVITNYSGAKADWITVYNIVLNGSVTQLSNFVGGFITRLTCQTINANNMTITLNTSGTGKENSPFIATDDNSSVSVTNVNCSTTTSGAVQGVGFIGWANGFGSASNLLNLSNVSVVGNFTSTGYLVAAIYGYLVNYTSFA